MIREIFIGNAIPLQFGSYVKVQIASTIDGVQVFNEYMTFDANKFSVVYDTQNPNIVVFHFGNIMQSVGNADYNQFRYAAFVEPTLIAFAQNVIIDISSYTT
jgi:hypothetical protein